MTLLRSSDLFPLDPAADVKIYPFVTGRTQPDRVQAKLDAAIAQVLPNASIVGSPEEADFAFVWARPEINLFEDDKEGVTLSVDPRDNGVDVDRVQEIQNATRTILAVNLINPWLLGEIEPGADAVVATFEIAPEHLLRSLTGEDGGPQGQLPLTPPASFDAVKAAGRDVPGKFRSEEDEDYAYRDRDGVSYVYGHGLRF